MELKGKRILVTGGAGFLGNRIVAELVRRGAEPGRISIPRSSTADLSGAIKQYRVDLRDPYSCAGIAGGQDIIIHAAGNVGGIGKNRREPGTLLYENAVMGLQLMEAARIANVSKFVTIGTVCSYPKNTPVPFSESELWNGYPEETNAPYGLAKKLLLVQGQAYRQQYGMNVIHLLPVNLYGPGDSFDPETGHVIPALIRKVQDAINTGAKSITIWGTGTPTREFLYVNDAAAGIVQATVNYDGAEPVNLGSGAEISILDLAKLIAGLMGYKGTVETDATMPNGQPRRMLDTTRAKELFRWEATTALEYGLERTIAWYRRTVADDAGVVS